MKVYLLEVGEYEQRVIDSVYSTREAAEQAAKERSPSSFEIMEYEVE